MAQKVAMVWLDPDDPGELFGHHLLTSCRRPAPLWFRSSDYGTPEFPLGSPPVRRQLAPVLGYEPAGPVRMLTQARMWGWLFNPITFYFAWSDSNESLVGVVAEVTNTPWNERHRYPVVLAAGPDGISKGSFPKVMHVSPFLGLDYAYQLSVRGYGPNISITIDVVKAEASDPDGSVQLSDRWLTTRLKVRRIAPSSKRTRQFLWSNAGSTYNVTRGIYSHAARLWRKGVAFVPHPENTGRRSP